MKTLVVVGSRTLSGKTGTAATALAEGIRAAGGAVEFAALPERTMERCRQCGDDGWGICRTEGRCMIEDDFAALVDEVRLVDLVVFATPVYFGDLSESLRAFTDRLRRITRHTTGQQGIAGKPAIAICVAGGGGGGAPNCTVAMERALGPSGFDVVDVIPVRRQNLDLKLEVLRTTGKWLASPGKRVRTPQC